MRKIQFTKKRYLTPSLEDILFSEIFTSENENISFFYKFFERRFPR